MRDYNLMQLLHDMATEASIACIYLKCVMLVNLLFRNLVERLV